jgi:methylenetetrahydrofolate dehydrogenase (NADP+) / methenyltetrahydrofolate cyclohydrolase
LSLSPDRSDGASPFSFSLILQSMSHDYPAAANLLDGEAVARGIREKVRAAAAALARDRLPPRLMVFLVGQNPASEAYVGGKTRAARDAGLRTETVRLPVEAPPEELLARIDAANRDPDVDGILVQLPLPPGHDTSRVLAGVDPLKDVDGFHPENVGLLHQGHPRFTPCTPAGILALLDAYEVPVSGGRAIVLGRSDIVGKPTAALLTSRDATVTVAHSRTRHLSALCREGDLLVVAIGRAGLVTPEFVRPGAVVVDVGMNRLNSLEEAPENLRSSLRIRQALQSKGRALVGDVDFDAVSRVAGRITPVPGGVGPLTVAMLLRNTVQAATFRSIVRTTR